MSKEMRESDMGGERKEVQRQEMVKGEECKRGKWLQFGETEGKEKGHCGQKCRAGKEKG